MLDALPMRALGRFHDRLTGVSAALAAVAVGAITYCYCHEVVARYFFDAPTSWANETSTHLALVGVMLMFPYVTRERGHVAITFLFEVAGERRARPLVVGALVVAAAVCLLSVWFTAVEAERQFVRDVRMLDNALTPKWWLSAWFVYGFASSGLHFLRHIADAWRGAGPTATTGGI